MAALAAVVLLAGGCGGEAVDTADSPRLERLFRVDSLDRPESVAWDGRRGRWLVTNVGEGDEGKGDEGEGAGFVTVVSAGGDSLRRRAYGGPDPGPRLDQPRGILVLADTAWIADLHRVVALDLAGDSLLFRVRLEGSRLLNDVARGGEGPLYVSDTGGDAVWRVATDGSSYGRLGTVGSLRRPNGLLAGDTPGPRQELLVAGWDGAVLALNPDSSVTLLAEAPSFRHLDGLQPAPDGGLLVGDFGTGRIHHLRRRSPEVWRTGDPWLTGLTAPADFLVRDSLLALPELEADRVTFYRIGSR